MVVTQLLLGVTQRKTLCHKNPKKPMTLVTQLSDSILRVRARRDKPERYVTAIPHPLLLSSSDTSDTGDTTFHHDHIRALARLRTHAGGALTPECLSCQSLRHNPSTLAVTGS